jgi:hypothetical protein
VAQHTKGNACCDTPRFQSLQLRALDVDEVIHLGHDIGHAVHGGFNLVPKRGAHLCECEMEFGAYGFSQSEKVNNGLR